MKSRILQSRYRLVVCESRWTNQIDHDMDLLGRNDGFLIARSSAVWVSYDRTSCSMEKYLKCSKALVWGEVLELGVFEIEFA